MTTQRDDYVSPAAELGAMLAPFLAEEIRALVARHRVKQRELSDLLGVAQSGVSARMNGHQPFALEEIVALAHYFGTDPAMLLGQATMRMPQDRVELALRKAGEAGEVAAVSVLDESRYGIRDSNPEPADLEHGRLISLDDGRRRLRPSYPVRRSA